MCSFRVKKVTESMLLTWPFITQTQISSKVGKKLGDRYRYRYTNWGGNKGKCRFSGISWWSIRVRIGTFLGRNTKQLTELLNTLPPAAVTPPSILSPCYEYPSQHSHNQIPTYPARPPQVSVDNGQVFQCNLVPVFSCCNTLPYSHLTVLLEISGRLTWGLSSIMCPTDKSTTKTQSNVLLIYSTWFLETHTEWLWWMNPPTQD